MALKKKIYARSVVRRIKKEIADHPDRVLIFSPYLTPQTAETVIAEANSDSAEIYTIFDAETFASGGSSIGTIRRLLESGFDLFNLPKLHAKVILTDKFASVGSQNLTNGGTINREVSIVLNATKEVDYLRSEILKWRKYRSPISLEMVEDMERLIPELQKSYKEFKKLTALADGEIDAEILNREQEKRLNEEKKERRAAARLLKIENERQERLRERSTDLRNAVKSPEVQASTVLHTKIMWKPIYNEWGDSIVRHYSTLARRNNQKSFTKWWVKTENQALEQRSLIKRNRYLLISLDNGRLGWPALNQTQITRFGTGLKPIHPYTLGDYNYLFDFDLATSKEQLEEWNVKVRLRQNNPFGLRTKVNVWGYFSLSEFKIVKWSLEDGTDKDLPSVKALVSHIKSGSAVNSLIIRALLEPFSYKWNGQGIYADNFFSDQGKYFDIQLRKFSGYNFLTAESSY